MGKEVKKFDFKKPPRKIPFYLTWLVKLICETGLKSRKFKCEYVNLQGLKPPYILLSNHSSIVDLMAMMKVTNYKVNNVASIEAFHDYTEWLFRRLGVIAKRKFTKDLYLIKNIKYSLEKLGNVFCIFPEARYSLDGCTSYLPDSLGKLMKLFKVPVVVMNLKGNHLSHPQWHKKGNHVHVEATVTQIVDQEEIKTLSVEEINRRIKEHFVYDDFAWAKANGVKITRKDRAEGLNGILYQCPHCKTEHQMYSKGNKLWCEACGKQWEMSELCTLKALEGETEFSHIPDWFKWERANVREQVRNGTYHIEDEVRIDTMPNSKGFIKQGNGYFVHDCNGMTLSGTAYGKPFVLKKQGCEQESIHVEYHYKHGGDCFDLATTDESYWFYPLNKRDILTKVSFATEEIYFMNMEKVKQTKPE